MEHKKTFTKKEINEIIKGGLELKKDLENKKSSLLLFFAGIFLGILTNIFTGFVIDYLKGWGYYILFQLLISVLIVALSVVAFLTYGRVKSDIELMEKMLDMFQEAQKGKKKIVFGEPLEVVKD
jgi:hypothetical protein